MKVTKYGHACLLVEEGGTKFLIDPGSYNPVPDATGVNAILYTHDHPDHLDVPMLRAILEKNPEALVITSAAVSEKLGNENIDAVVLVERQSMEVNGVSVEAHGSEHAFIYGDMPTCQNIGFLIAGRFYHPGDALHIPAAPVEILALPVAGPWMKLSEAIEYAKQVKPRVAFPMHDGFFAPGRDGTSRRYPKMILEPLGIEFHDMTDGSVAEF